MGMALDTYTNCTSPLRKYVDFLVHLQIIGTTAPAKSDQDEPPGTATLAPAPAKNTRTATQEAERWLAGGQMPGGWPPAART